MRTPTQRPRLDAWNSLLPLRATNWKLNESLIIEDIDRKQIADDLALYFKENTHSDITPGILWETHKAHIRGKLMELGARKKNAYSNKLSYLEKLRPWRYSIKQA